MDKLQGMEQTVNEIRDALKKRGSASGASNTNTIKIEGAGSIWHGLAVGIALGAVIIGGAWIVSTQQRLEMIAQQSEAYSKAVYMLAPRFAEEIDKELDKSKEKK
jgi:hypothetical protein